MKNSVVIKKNDYERYKIPISVFNLFPKRKKNFLWDELEKRHPCFSDDFCYSAKDVISKDGLVEDVVVIEKSKLAEYKNQCSCFGKLSLEESFKRNIFSNKKISPILIFSAAVLFIILLFIIKIFLLPKIDSLNNTATSENILGKNVLEENNQIMKNYKLYDKNILPNIFKLARENSGKITSLNWSLSSLGENINCSLDNIYPEQLEEEFPDLKIPVVKYTDKRPYIDFSFVNKFAINTNFQNDNIPLNTKKVVRTFLKNNGIDMKEETTFPAGIVFECNISTFSEDNIMTKFSELLYSLGIYAIGIQIAPLEVTEKNHKFHIYIGFSNNQLYKNNIMEIIGKNLDLFFNNSVQKFVPLEKKSKYILNNSYPEKNYSFLPKGSVKVGEIVYQSGRKVVFFKNSNGQINRRELVAGNEM